MSFVGYFACLDLLLITCNWPTCEGYFKCINSHLYQHKLRVEGNLLFSLHLKQRHTVCLLTVKKYTEYVTKAPRFVKGGLF